MNRGANFHGKKADVQARHAAVLEAIRARGVAHVDDVWPHARRATGATRSATKQSLARLLELGRIEVAERGTNRGKPTTYRVTEGAETNGP
jgi:hypothetical protein